MSIWDEVDALDARIKQEESGEVIVESTEEVEERTLKFFSCAAGI